ncbi:hypothetical protein [Pseudomonas sp. NPDC089401]|uniref:hypothetical protein n=1 Tax=Pseudomonas sp. NPDC089401 TaxID=3364462 RepID=UPI00382F4719
MNESISGSVSSPALPPVSFSLEVYGSAARRFERDAAKRQADDAAEHKAKLRRIKEEVEIKAAEFASIMLDKHIAEALDPSIEPRLRRDLRNDVLNRGIGRPAEAEKDDAKARDTAAQNLLDVLAAMSTNNRTIESAGKAVPRIERDVTPEHAEFLEIDLNQFNVTEE